MTDLERLLEELVSVIKMTPDPFKVRVGEILDELSEALSRDGDLTLDGEIISLLARVVKEQEEWVKREASIAAVGRIIALLKIRALDEKELAKELIRHWRPIVDISQVTFPEIYLALSYLESRKEYGLGEVEAEEVEAGTYEPGIDLRKVIEEVEAQLDLLLEEGRVPYGEVVRGGDPDEVLLRAYALSYLATMGRVTITYDPIEDEYYVERAGEGEPHSLIVQLGRYLDAS